MSDEVYRKVFVVPSSNPRGALGVEVSRAVQGARDALGATTHLHAWFYHFGILGHIYDCTFVRSNREFHPLQVERMVYDLLSRELLYPPDTGFVS